MKSFRITVNGNTYDVDVEEIQGGRKAHNTTSQGSVAIEPSSSNVPVHNSGGGAVKINAPMQGKIVGVKVSEGEQVNNGDVVAILEAMKMENEIVASESGTVASVNVVAGQSVDVGDLIITLD